MPISYIEAQREKDRESAKHMLPSRVPIEHNQVPADATYLPLIPIPIKQESKPIDTLQNNRTFMAKSILNTKISYTKLSIIQTIQKDKNRYNEDIMPLDSAKIYIELYHESIKDKKK
jgi:hypothetical protein